MATQTYDERLHRLLTTAARVFADQGFHRTTMRDLSRATGMSLAGMYHYVAGKEELLYLIQRECFQQVHAGARAAVDGVGDAVERLRAFIRHHVTFFTGHMSEMKVLSHEAGSLSGEREHEILALKRRYVALLAEIIGAVTDERDPRIAAYGLFGMMNWIYTWYHPGGAMGADELADQFAEIFLRGVASPAGAGRSGA